MIAAVSMVLGTLPFILADDAAGSVDRDATFPEIEISRAGSHHEWPFSVDRGTLSCVTYDGTRTVFFAEPWRDDVPQEFGDMTLPRMVAVSTNPIVLFVSIENRDLYLPFDSIEILTKRLAPFEIMGLALCEADDPAPRKTFLRN
ncbi:MAG: hypothetical protein H6893_03110 [Brucellaceae bacterium]|nr:hypothetical protein [Brucellaceae bacterium]